LLNLTPSELLLDRFEDIRSFRRIPSCEVYEWSETSNVAARQQAPRSAGSSIYLERVHDRFRRLIAACETVIVLERYWPKLK
jgi:hypothetical protein